MSRSNPEVWGFYGDPVGWIATDEGFMVAKASSASYKDSSRRLILDGHAGAVGLTTDIPAAQPIQGDQQLDEGSSL